MITEMIAFQLRLNHQVVKTNIGEITHEESLKQPAPAGNCANWVLAHLVSTRSEFLRGLGGTPVWNEEDCRRYGRHSAPVTSEADAKPLEEIWKAYDQSQERLLEALKRLTPEKLREPLPAGLKDVPFDSMSTLIAFLGMHDAYHTGQTGVLRRLLGKAPADI
jgi:uncharacterized damage-inducible protein DinB